MKKLMLAVLGVMCFTGMWGGVAMGQQAETAKTTGMIFMDDRPQNIANATGQEALTFRLVFGTMINYFLFFLGLLCTTMIIYGGFIYITSAGDDGKTEEAKKILIYSAVGILVILLSWVIVNSLLSAGRTETHSEQGSDLSG